MPKGSNDNNNRGRGNGYGRGGGRGYRGRGRGESLRGQGGHPDRNNYTHPNAEIDVVIQQWTPEPLDAGGNLDRGGGSWRGGTPRSRARTPLGGTGSPRRGGSTPRGTGRGRGRGGDHSFNAPRYPHVGFGSQKKGGLAKVAGGDAPLSNLLYSERPLLRPIKFVRATFTPFLFQESEELLNSVSEQVGTTEGSHVPTAEQVARVFSGIQRPFPSDSASESEASDQLEEIDFADLGEIRARVDAIAAVTKHQGPQEEIEEIDFADLAVFRAQVDAAVPTAKPKASSRDLTVEEAFTGLYNIKDTIQLSSSMDVIDDSQQDVTVQQVTSSTSFTAEDAEDNTTQTSQQSISIEVLDVSTDEPSAEAQDGLVMEEEAHPSSTRSVDVPMIAPQEVLSAAPPDMHTTPNILADSSSKPDAPLTDDFPPLFVIDTEPTRPFTNRSASDVILVDRTGGSATLGEEDELIVYVAPHPRSGRASPIPVVPRVKLPTSSILTGKSPTLTSGLRSPIREDEDDGVPNDMIANQDQIQIKPTPPSLSSLTLDFSSAVTNKQPRTRPVFTPSERFTAALKARTKKALIHQLRKRNKGSAFGSFGAALSEARLREDDERERRHPKWETRRRGDSDVDWGTEGEEGGDVDDEVDQVSNGLGGMDLDPDLTLDMNAMKGFVQSMSAEGSRFMTMDDLEDQAQMQQEDDGDPGGPMGSSNSGSSDEDDSEDDREDEAIFNAEEEILIAESEREENHAINDNGGEVSEDSSDDDDDFKRSPGSSFQARLRKIREHDPVKLSGAAQEIPDDDDSTDNRFPPSWTRSADDEEFLAHINDLLEKNSQILDGCSRKQRKEFFRNLHHGYVDDYDELMDIPDFSIPVKKGNKGKGKAGYYPTSEMQAQWEKDRAKKAERKRQRDEARLLAALDPSSHKSGGKKSRKAALAASKLDPALVTSIVPNAIVDWASLEAQMRYFVADIGGKQSMVLPPMDRASRKEVHELAAALGLTSRSKGTGARRYTTLMKTTRTGTINEGKLKAITKQLGKTFDRAYAYDRKEGKGKGGKGQMPRHRDGDEVGKEAPKIGQSNVGFKMLASMGWSEGDRIGGTASVGIEAPLTAIIKNSKLGLGATR